MLYYNMIAMPPPASERPASPLLDRPLLDRPLLDRAAVALSGLCLLHCLAGVALVGVFALSGGFLAHQVHAVGLALAVPLALVALGRGVMHHGRIDVLLLGLAGLALMAASLLVDHGTAAEIGASVTGVVLLAVAHLRNLRAVRR